MNAVGVPWPPFFGGLDAFVRRGRSGKGGAVQFVAGHTFDEDRDEVPDWMACELLVGRIDHGTE